MPRKNIFIIISLVIAVFGVSFYSYKLLGKKKKFPHLLISGNIEAPLVKVRVKIPGEISKIFVDEGDIVKEGDLIAKLEDTELIDQKERAAVSLESSQLRVQTLLASIQKEEKTSIDEIYQAEATLLATQARYSRLLSGSSPQEIEQAKAEVELTKSELVKEEKNMERMKYLYQGTHVSPREWELAKAAYEVSLAKHKKTTEYLALVKEGPRKEEIEEARAQVEKEKASLSLSHSKRLQSKIYQQELEVLKTQTKESKATLKVALRQLEYSMVFAPVSGTVLIKSVEVGDYVSPGTTVVTIADLDHVWLEAHIDEAGLGRVKLGQKARIKTDIFPGKVYEGRISFISSEAEFTPKQMQTPKERPKVVYRIKVDVENSNRELKPGMPAHGEILISEN